MYYLSNKSILTHAGAMYTADGIFSVISFGKDSDLNRITKDWFEKHGEKIDYPGSDKYLVTMDSVKTLCEHIEAVLKHFSGVYTGCNDVDSFCHWHGFEQAGDKLVIDFSNCPAEAIGVALLDMKDIVVDDTGKALVTKYFPGFFDDIYFDHEIVTGLWRVYYAARTALAIGSADNHVIFYRYDDPDLQRY